ncbi:MAG: DUF2179 domain-containing protein [Nanobdellota archaeon]
MDIYMIIMPIIILIARILEMTLGTMRVGMVAKGFKNIAPMIGFIEMIIWAFVARKIMGDLGNAVWIIAYAAGFGLGTYIGMTLSEKISLGKVLIRAITKTSPAALQKELKEKGFGSTVVDSAGSKSKSTIIFTIVQSKKIKEVVNIILKHNPRAFYTIEEVRQVNEGTFPENPNKFKYALGIFPFRRGR